MYTIFRELPSVIKANQAILQRQQTFITLVSVVEIHYGNQTFTVTGVTG